MKKKKEKNSNKELSQEWFENHEEYKDEEENEGGERTFLEKGEFFEEEEFHKRVNHFLANQEKDVSLENILEISESPLEKKAPVQKKEENDAKEIIDYLKKGEEDELKYDVFKPDTEFLRPDMSSAEKILEKQKAIYSPIKKLGGEMIVENKSELGTIRPEDTIKKDYLTKKRI